MIRAALLGLTTAVCAIPAAAQDYYATTTTARHGNGYLPSSVVAGWEGEESFTVIAFAADGSRVTGASTAATDWKATVITGPRAEAEDDDEEDERYLDKLETNPPKHARTGPPVPRTERVYASTACPAVMTRMQALKPLATFEFDPPGFKGNKDGAVGDGREGYDLWMRVGGAELSKSAETPDSALGRWFAETMRAFAGCPSKSRTTG
jgi:hypothetical protein